MKKWIGIEINGKFYRSLHYAEHCLGITMYVIKKRSLSNDWLNYKIIPFITHKKKRCPVCEKTKPIKEFHKKADSRDGVACKCKQCTSDWSKENYKNNTKRITQKNKEWRANNRCYMREYGKNWMMEKRAKDPVFRINTNMKTGIYESLKGNKNGLHWETFVDYNLEGLMAHLESKFTEGMSWENYGKGGWVIDHIIAIHWWSITSYDCQGFKDCWSLDNLQPLWEIRNWEKGTNPMHLKYLIKPDCIKLEILT